MSNVKTTRNSQGGWTVRWPAAKQPGYFYEKNFTPAVGYPCRAEARAFAKEKKKALGK